MKDARDGGGRRELEEDDVIVPGEVVKVIGMVCSGGFRCELEDGRVRRVASGRAVAEGDRGEDDDAVCEAVQLHGGDVWEDEGCGGDGYLDAAILVSEAEFGAR